MSGDRTARHSEFPRTALDVRDEAKRLAARALDRAMRACGYSNEDVGNLLGVDEARVRRLRSDDKKDLDVIPNAADVLLANHALGERFLAELRSERARLHGLPPAITVEQQLAVAVRDALALADGGVGALADGIVDAPEVPDIDRRAAKCEGSLQVLRAQLRGRSR